MIVSAIVGILFGMAVAPAVLLLTGRRITGVAWSVTASLIAAGWMFAELARWWRT